MAWPGGLMHCGLEDPTPAMVPTKGFRRHKNHTSPLTPVSCTHADKAAPAKATPAPAAPELHRQVGREVDGGPALAAGSPFALGRPQRALQRRHLQHGGCAARWVARPAMAAVWEAAALAAAAGWPHGSQRRSGSGKRGINCSPADPGHPQGRGGLPAAATGGPCSQAARGSVAVGSITCTYLHNEIGGQRAWPEAAGPRSRSGVPSLDSLKRSALHKVLE